MIRYILAFLLIGTAYADPCNAPLPTKPGTVFGGTVDWIIDGDGLCVQGIEVRLGDFNAPELREPGGKEAKAALTEIAMGKHVDCVACLGARNPRKCKSHDRVIATCAIDGRGIGEIMRERGVREGGR